MWNWPCVIFITKVPHPTYLKKYFYFRSRRIFITNYQTFYLHKLSVKNYSLFSSVLLYFDSNPLGMPLTELIITTKHNNQAPINPTHSNITKNICKNDKTFTISGYLMVKNWWAKADLNRSFNLL